MTWNANIGIFYDPSSDSYYVVEFNGYFRYNIGSYRESIVIKHKRCLSAICNRLSLNFFGYKGACVSCENLPNPKKIVKVRCSYGKIEDIEPVNDFKGELIYATHGQISVDIESFDNIRTRFAECLSKIPFEKWIEIVKREPEWIHMKSLLEKFSFGKFVTTMVVLGLNNFALKESAEIGYWPPLAEILSKAEVPKEPYDLYHILKPFYEEHYVHKPESRETKVHQMDTFLKSDLAKELWNSTPEWVAKNLKNIWRWLLDVMKFLPRYKQSSFTLKCLGIALMMAGVYDFDFSGIPIPVDYRVKLFTNKTRITKSDSEIIECYNDILNYLRQKDPRINMIILDSLIWQIAKLDDYELKQYFETLECPEVYECLRKFMR